MQPTQIAYDKIATLYPRNRALHPAVLHSLLAHSDISKKSRVLEVGCGTGNYLSAIQLEVGCVAYGADLSAQMLSFAQTRAHRLYLYQASAEALGVRSRAFAFVFSVDVIHHVGARAGYFREAYRVLEASGKLCTVTDSAWIIRNRQPLSTYFPESVDKELARYSRIGKLRDYMTEVGFRNLAEKTVELHDELTDLQPYRDKAFSSLHLISEQAHQAGIACMEADLQHGPIPYVARYLLLWGTK